MEKGRREVVGLGKVKSHQLGSEGVGTEVRQTGDK